CEGPQSRSGASRPASENGPQPPRKPRPEQANFEFRGTSGRPLRDGNVNPEQDRAPARRTRPARRDPPMRWSNVFLIFRREVRDQLRDRRTLFMIFILPLLLYPILGIGVAQFSTALEQKPRRVVVIGAEHLPEAPALLNETKTG